MSLNFFLRGAMNLFTSSDPPSLGKSDYSINKIIYSHPAKNANMAIDNAELSAIAEIEQAMNVKVVLENKDMNKPGLPNHPFYTIKEGHIEHLIFTFGSGINKCPSDGKTIPDAIGRLRWLKSLRIYMPLVKLPDAIGNLAELQRFDLSPDESRNPNHQIQVLPEAIGNWRKIEEVTIRDTRIKALPESVGNWTNLKECYLESTLLTNLPVSTYNWVNLTEFIGDGSQFTLIPAVIATWKNLSKFRLRAQKQCHLGDDLLIYLEALQLGSGNYSVIEGEGIKYLQAAMVARLRAIASIPDEFFVVPSSQGFSCPPFELQVTFNHVFGDKFQEHGCTTDREIDEIMKRGDVVTAFSGVDKNILTNYMFLLAKRQDFNRARTAVQVFKKLFPSTTINSDNEFVKAMVNDPKTLEKDTKNILKNNTNKVKVFDIQRTLAYAISRQGKWKDAEEIFNQMVKKIPKYDEYWINLAYLHIALGKKSLAKEELNTLKNMVLNFDSSFSLQKIDELLEKLQ